MQTHTHSNYYSLSLSIHILPFLTQEQTTNFSTYSLVKSYITFFLSSFSLIIPSGTSSTTAASLCKTRHHSCSERAYCLAEGYCYHCSRMGHMARACPLGQQQKPMRDAEVVVVPVEPEATQPEEQQHF